MEDIFNKESDITDDKPKKGKAKAKKIADSLKVKKGDGETKPDVIEAEELLTEDEIESGKKEEAEMEEYSGFSSKKMSEDLKEGARIYGSKYRGLKIIVDPTGRIYSEQYRRWVSVPGKAIKFDNYKFSTTDEDTVIFLEDYMKNHPGEIFCISQAAVENAEALRIGKEILAKRKTGGKQAGRQGAVGATH